MRHPLRALAPLLLSLLLASPVAGQWTNRYPKVAGYSHHVYLEGYELPTLAAGPLDAAASPDGETLAVAARGWLWLLDLDDGTARQLTSGAGLDSRPAFSPDGGRVAFVRDDGSDTSIVLLDLSSGEERVVVDEPVLELDPAFGPDGDLYYSSAAAGDLDLWRLDLEAGEATRITERGGIELSPRPHPDGRHVVYVAKRHGPDRVVLRNLEDGGERVLHQGTIQSQLRPALSPDGGLVAFNAPAGQGDGWELRVVSVARGGPSVLLAGGPGRLPLTPAWSADGETVFFSEASRDERMRLFRVPAVGGDVEAVPVRAWEPSGPTGRVVVRTRVAGSEAVAPARLTALDPGGHPLFPETAQPRFDGQTGTVFFYSPGATVLEAPVGEVTVRAVRGLATPPVEGTARILPGHTAELELLLEPLWDAGASGWTSGEHHFHLNYGGPYRLEPDDVVLQARGEDLDVATPLVANLHERFGEQALWGGGSGSGASGPLVRFGQEVRSHFLGHLGLLGIQEPFWPWIWGPGYEVYGADDRPNAEALAWARRQGGVGYYVHPVSGRDPFRVPGAPSLPVELVADAVLGDVDALEVACLWSDELGTAEAWYRFLNIGRPVAPTAGTDAMSDFYRTMAIGTTRVYVRTEGATDFGSYLDGLRAGRSFVTNGPLLELDVEGSGPGGTVDADGGAAFSLEVHTAVPVDRVEILVNGAVAWSGEPMEAPGSRSFQGTLELPQGGWIAARAVGPETTSWPAMDSYAFGHTAPVWIGAVGSTEPRAERAAAAELMLALDNGLMRLRRTYAGHQIPRLEERFAAARAELQARLPEEPADDG